MLLFTLTSARRTLDFGYGPRKRKASKHASDCTFESSHHGASLVNGMETIQRCDDKSSTFEYDSRSTQCPVIMDHPYAQEILLPISVRDVGTSPINFFQHSGKLSGIETLRSSVDSKGKLAL